MKKYALTLFLAVFSVVALSSYYVYSATDRMPQFTLTTLEGDERLVQSLILDGTYNGSTHLEGISVTAAGSDYHSRRSVWRDQVTEPRSRMREEADIAQLLDEYRGFMRGKGALNQFYQDEEFVIYAGTAFNRNQAAIRFRMEVLDRANGRTEKFHTEMDADETYFYVNTLDVQRMGEEVHLLARAVYPEQPDELWLYVLDLRDGMVKRSEKLTLRATLDEDVNLLSDDIPSAPNEYAAILIHTIEEEGRYWNDKLKTYHYPTGQVTEAPSDWASKRLENEVRPNDPKMILDGNQVYRYQHNRKTLHISIYHADTQETGGWSVNMEDLGGHWIQEVSYENGSFYVLYKYDEDTMLRVFDALTGERLYLGQVTAEGDAAPFHWIGNLTFRY